MEIFAIKRNFATYGEHCSVYNKTQAGRAISSVWLEDRVRGS